MQSGASAYQETAKIAASPRDREAELLLKAAVQLQYVQDAGATNRGALYRALHYNRKLWTVFVAAMANEDNQLPPEIKNNIASLGLFIFNHTLDVQSNPSPDKLSSLISINREIAAGLRGQGS